MIQKNHVERIIGKYTGNETGPLLFVFGAIHGNETAGVEAIRLLLKMLEVEHISNPSFKFKGKIVGLFGNIQASMRCVRYIHSDLNRIWHKPVVDRIKKNGIALNPEENELLDLIKTIEFEIELCKPEKVVVLDLHTTSSSGGIFSIPGGTQESLRIATNLHAPVIKGMLDGIAGTTLHYCNEENLGIETHGVIFESGQHEDPLSVNRALAGTINCLRSIGCVSENDVENIHDRLLIEYSENLPIVSKLLYKYDIRSNDQFEMAPGYQNFQKIRRGEKIARNSNGTIYSPVAGRILMPLYQTLGNEGFFIVRESF